MFEPEVPSLRPIPDEEYRMSEKVNHLPESEFVTIWNASETLEQAAQQVKAVVGTPCPRWAVMARAAAIRDAGVGMRDLPSPLAIPARS